jgi:hypothetical protein
MKSALLYLLQLLLDKLISLFCRFSFGFSFDVSLCSVIPLDLLTVLALSTGARASCFLPLIARLRLMDLFTLLELCVLCIVIFMRRLNEIDCLD